jgi:hypothetical protein
MRGHRRRIASIRGKRLARALRRQRRRGHAPRSGPHASAQRSAKRGSTRAGPGDPSGDSDPDGEHDPLAVRGIAGVGLHRASDVLRRVLRVVAHALTWAEAIYARDPWAVHELPLMWRLRRRVCDTLDRLEARR